MPPPYSVTGEVYCFPRSQLIFSFGRRVIYHSKGLWEYIPKSIPSLCTTIFKRIAALRFYHKSLMLCMNGFVSTSFTKKWNPFLKFRIRFWIFDRRPKNTHTVFKGIAGLRFYIKSLMLYINGFVSTSSRN